MQNDPDALLQRSFVAHATSLPLLQYSDDLRPYQYHYCSLTC